MNKKKKVVSTLKPDPIDRRRRQFGKNVPNHLHTNKPGRQVRLRNAFKTYVGIAEYDAGVPRATHARAYPLCQRAVAVDSMQIILSLSNTIRVGREIGPALHLLRSCSSAVISSKDSECPILFSVPHYFSPGEWGTLHNYFASSSGQARRTPRCRRHRAWS
jgi:hypothetical protein